MSDLIDRQAAIDAIHEDADWLAAQGSDWQVERMERDKSILKSLPTVQPTITHEQAIDYLHETGWLQNHDRILTESKMMMPVQPTIVRCRDCKYSIDVYNDGDCYCKRPSRELVWIGKSWDFFCKAGAKREGE